MENVIDNRYINGLILIKKFFKLDNDLDLNVAFNYSYKLNLELASLYNEVNNTNVSNLSSYEFFKISTGFDFDKSLLNKIIREYTLKDIIDDNR